MKFNNAKELQEAINKLPDCKNDLVKVMRPKLKPIKVSKIVKNMYQREQ